MEKVQHRLRRRLRVLHLWTGLICGLPILLMIVTGGILAIRPQITALLSPNAGPVSACIEPTNWTQAQHEVEAFSGTRFDRVYFNAPGDPRVEFRVPGPANKIFRHVIYDSCTGKVLGWANLAWMDWVVDFHHNLRAEHSGRQWGGVIAIALLFASVSGFVMWFCTGARFARAFTININASPLRLSLDLHRVFGLVSGCILLLASFTAIWLCYPQTMRVLIGGSDHTGQKAHRADRSRSALPAVGLGDWIHSAQLAIPGGIIREIRLPEAAGAVQFRIWREGDFRSTGNNTVLIDPVTAAVVQTQLYRSQPPRSRFLQAMTGLHYGEWGGFGFRYLYAVVGLVTPVLIVTGFAIWWLTRPRKRPHSHRQQVTVAAEELSTKA